MSYLLHLSVIASIYVLLAVSLNLVIGFAGRLSLCHGAFYGLGAYTYTLLTVDCGWPFIAAAGTAVAAVAFVGMSLAAPSLRLTSHYFVLGTLGFQIVVYSLLYNLTSITRGPFGISRIPRPTILGVQVSDLPEFVALQGVTTLVICVLVWLFSRSPFVRTLQALRDDEIASISLGKSPVRFRTVAFGLAAGIAALAGVSYACFLTFVDPLAFGLEESVFMAAAVILGGTANFRGPVVGGLVLALLPEALRFVHLPDAIAADIRQLILGALLILMMRIRPQGLLGNYAFD